MGPLLFLAYKNDIPECISSGSKLGLYADDGLLYRKIHQFSDSAVLQDDLNELQVWELKWLMKFNPEKCFTLRITNKIKPINSTYFICGHQLDPATDCLPKPKHKQSGNHGSATTHLPNTAKYLGVSGGSRIYEMGIQIRCEADALTPFMQWQHQELNFRGCSPSLSFPSPSPVPFLPFPSHPMYCPVPPIPYVTFPLPSSIPSLSLPSLLPSSSPPSSSLSPPFPHSSSLPFPILSPSLPQSGPLKSSYGVWGSL